MYTTTLHITTNSTALLYGQSSLTVAAGSSTQNCSSYRFLSEIMAWMVLISLKTRPLPPKRLVLTPHVYPLYPERTKYCRGSCLGLRLGSDLAVTDFHCHLIYDLCAMAPTQAEQVTLAICCPIVCSMKQSLNPR